VVLAAQLCLVLGGVALWVVNPYLRAAAAAEPERVARREWLRPEFVALCVGASASIALLATQDLTMVAAMRHFHAQSWLGLVLALWAGGSLVGGLIYGLLRRPVSPYLLLAGLGVTALACVAATGPLALGFAVVVAGLCCAPSQTAFVDEVSRIVPENGRGEALGWYAAALTAGTAIGNGSAGPVIDAGGYRGGFLLSAVLGVSLGVALHLLVAMRSRTAPDLPRLSAPGPAGDRGPLRRRRAKARGG
jgi:MFS family permease